MDPHSVNFFSTLEEPWRGCLLFLNRFLLGHPCGLTVKWRNNTPFYFHREKWFAYISYHHKTREIYLAIVDARKISHPKLKGEGRKKMKAFHIDPSEDIDVKSLDEILQKATGTRNK